MNIKTALGIGSTAIFQSQVFPFLLSSTFTARTIVKEKGETNSVKQDVWIATGISIAFTIVMAILLNDTWTLLFGILFSFILLWIYLKRGELI